MKNRTVRCAHARIKYSLSISGLKWCTHSIFLLSFLYAWWTHGFFCIKKKKGLFLFLGGQKNKINCQHFLLAEKDIACWLGKLVDSSASGPTFPIDYITQNHATESANSSPVPAAASPKIFIDYWTLERTSQRRPQINNIMVLLCARTLFVDLSLALHCPFPQWGIVDAEIKVPPWLGVVPGLSKVISSFLKPGVGQNIALHATPAARTCTLPSFYLPNSFSFTFSPTSIISKQWKYVS